MPHNYSLTHALISTAEGNQEGRTACWRWRRDFVGDGDGGMARVGRRRGKDGGELGRPTVHSGLGSEAVIGDR